MQGLPQILKQNKSEQHSRCCSHGFTGSTNLILLLMLFSCSRITDSTVTFYITVVENKIRPPVLTDEIMVLEYSFLALLAFPQLPIFQSFWNPHDSSLCFCASPVAAVLWDWTAPKSTLQLHLPWLHTFGTW